MVKGRKTLIAATAVFLIAAVLFCVFYSSNSNNNTVPASFNFSDETYSNGNGIDNSKMLLVDLTMSADSFEHMLKNANEKEIHEASVKLNGIDIGKIGIRPRGNSSIEMGYALGGRFSFELRLDEYSPATFNGIKRINLNSGGLPQFLFQEYLAYQLFDTMDVISPQAGFAFITINGQDWGVYLAVEEIDKTFLGKNFETSDGNLYKASETKSFFTNINGQKQELHFNHIQNKNDTKNAEITALYEEIQNAGDISKFIDKKQFIKFAACDFASGNTDGFVGSNAGANFCLYEQNGIFSAIPWDYDKALFGCFRSSNHYLYGMSENELDRFKKSPSFVVQLFKDEESRELYKKYILEICDKFYKEKYESLLINAVKLTDEYFKRDKTISAYDEWREVVLDAETMADGNMIILGEEMEKQLTQIVNGEADTFSIPNNDLFAFDKMMNDETDSQEDELPIEKIKSEIIKNDTNASSSTEIILSVAVIICAIAVAFCYKNGFSNH